MKHVYDSEAVQKAHLPSALKLFIAAINRRAGNLHGDVTDASGGHCRSHVRQTSGLLFVESLRCGLPPPTPPTRPSYSTSSPLRCLQKQRESHVLVHLSLDTHSLNKHTPKHGWLPWHWVNTRKRGETMSSQDGGVFLMWRGLVMCVCVFFAPVLLRWRAAWQSHYGLCKHTLTSHFKSLLPHMHTWSRVNCELTYATYTVLWGFFFFYSSAVLQMLNTCPAADTHVHVILIAYFSKFVYRIATCRSVINNIDRLWCSILFSLTHSSGFSLVFYFHFKFPLRASPLNIKKEPTTVVHPKDVLWVSIRK